MTVAASLSRLEQTRQILDTLAGKMTNDVSTKIEKLIDRFIACDQHSKVKAVLWVLHAHLIDAFEWSPFLGSSGSRVDESNGKYGLKPHGYWVFGVS